MMRIRYDDVPFRVPLTSEVGVLQPQPEPGSEADQLATGSNALEVPQGPQVQPESGAEEEQMATGGSAADRGRATVARRSHQAFLALSVLQEAEAAATTGGDADDDALWL